jgi:Spy/CpxP family protein refolding chaperone
MNANRPKLLLASIVGLAMLILGPCVALAQPATGSGTETTPRLGVDQNTMAQAGAAYMALLEIEAVQAELQLTAEQRGKCQQVKANVVAEARRRFATINPAERPDLAKQWEKELAHDAQTSIEAILVPAQLQRLRQIRLQIQGTAALYRPDVMRALGIDERQKDTLWAVATRARQRMQEAAQSLQRALGESRDSPAVDRNLAAMEQLRREADAQVMAVLTPQQQARFQQMMGTRFVRMKDEG